MRFIIEKYEKLTLDYFDLKLFEMSLGVSLKCGVDSLDFLSTMDGFVKGYVPVGSLKFVSNYLRKTYGIDRMEPIEVPEVLRTEDNLHRSYEILTKEELPKTGKYFLKYAGELKVFNNSLQEGNVASLFNKDKDSDTDFLVDGLYVVSEWVTVLSEYRVMVHEDNIEGIFWYRGNPGVLLDESVLHRMVTGYMRDSDRPMAYTMDLAVIQKGKERHTVILEVHPFVSVGLYGFYSDNLRLMYRDGLEYYINKNKKLR